MSLTANPHVTPLEAHSERRANPRFTVQVQIELHEGASNVPIRTETSDLSRGGCYVQLNSTLTPGNYVSGKLWLDDAPVLFRGRVVTCHPQFGNGIMFLEFEANGEHVLNRYLDMIQVDH